MAFLESLTNSVINAVDLLTLRYGQWMKSSITDYCDWDTPLDEHTLVTQTRSLVSVITIEGVYSHRGDQEFIEAIMRLKLLVETLLPTRAHSLQWVFARTPSQTTHMLADYFKPLRQAAKTQGLDETVLNILFAERLSVLTPRVSPESCVLVLKTHPEALGSLEQKAQSQERLADQKRRALKENGLPLSFGEFAQSPVVSVSRLALVHQATLQTLLKQLQGPGLNLVARLLTCHEALGAVRHLHHPKETHQQWRGVLPGDPLPTRDKPVMNGQQDQAFYPTIASQVFKRQAVIEGDCVRIGEDFWATTSLVLSPQTPQRFEDLLKALPSDLDWRLSVSFLGGDKRLTQALKTRRALAKVFRITNSKHNEPILNHCNELLAIHAQGEPLIGLRVQLTVRCDSKGEATRSLQLGARLLQAWGNTDTSIERGDPVDALVSSLPGLDSLDTGTTLIQPVLDSALLCPISRAVSPWHAFGTTLYRTPDGRVYPLQVCSSEQVAWIDLIFAKPGSGKSVLQNAQNLNLCLTPGLSQLPKIAILDIGPSSQGLVQLLKALLPAHRQGEAVHKTLKQDVSCSINPFDTAFGMRFPHSAKRDFLKSFLLLLFTQDGETRVKAGLGELSTMLIQETYKTFSDDYSPKTYNVYQEVEVDQWLAQQPAWVDSVTKGGSQPLTWWQITDQLAEQGRWELVSQAQRQAVPLLIDLTAILHTSQSIKDIYAKTVRGQDNYDHLLMMIRSASTEYPILGAPTQFNVGHARVVALDLADVTGRGSTYTLKKSGLMYMLGREVLVGSLYFGEADLGGLSPVYQTYHQRRINQDLGEIKRVCCDEYHRTADLEAVRLQMEQDMREGRKYKVAFSLASQRHQDFSKTMLGLATNIYLCNGAHGDELKKISEVFDLTPSEQHALKYDVHGPTKDGASFLLKAETKSGWLTQVLVNSLGLIELWALTSTAEDAVLRKKLIVHLPYFSALQKLAQAFPQGSAKEVILEQVKETGHTIERVIDDWVNRLVTQTTQATQQPLKEKENDA